MTQPKSLTEKIKCILIDPVPRQLFARKINSLNTPFGKDEVKGISRLNHQHGTNY